MIKVSSTIRLDPETIKGYAFQSEEEYDGVVEPELAITFYDGTLDKHYGEDAKDIFESLDKFFFKKEKKGK